MRNLLRNVHQLRTSFMLQPHGYVEGGTKVTDTRHYKSQMLIGENSRIFFSGDHSCVRMFMEILQQIKWVGSETYTLIHRMNSSCCYARFYVNPLSMLVFSCYANARCLMWCQIWGIVRNKGLLCLCVSVHLLHAKYRLAFLTSALWLWAQ